MTARPIRYQRQVSDRKGKIFYTSITSLSHISKERGQLTQIRCIRARQRARGADSAAERRRLFLLRGGDMNLSVEFEKWGRTLVIENTDSTQTAPFKGFIQPLRYKNKMYLYGVNTEIGYNSQGYYLYIGPPEHDLTVNEDALIIDGDIKYQIDRAEKIKFGEEVLYVWAVVRTVVEITE